MEEYRTLPNGDQLSLPEVEVMHQEAWADFGHAKRDPTTSLSRLTALEGKVTLWNRVLFRGFEPAGERIYPDADARRVSLHDDQPHPLDAQIAKARAALLANPTDSAKQFALSELQRKRYGG